MPGTGQRFGGTMLSALPNRGRLNVMVAKQRFCAKVFQAVLTRLVRQAPRTVVLIVDSHPVHRAGSVTAWVRQQTHRLRLFFLPGDSPELNPDALLNQDVKSNAVGRRRAHAQEQLVSTVRGYLRSRQRQPYVVRQYFEEQRVRYAAI